MPEAHYRAPALLPAYDLVRIGIGDRTQWRSWRIGAGENRVALRAQRIILVSRMVIGPGQGSYIYRIHLCNIGAICRAYVRPSPELHAGIRKVEGVIRVNPSVGVLGVMGSTTAEVRAPSRPLAGVDCGCAYLPCMNHIAAGTVAIGSLLDDQPNSRRIHPDIVNRVAVRTRNCSY